jgi:tetratricopeptide (TPR) repeat protein
MRALAIALLVTTTTAWAAGPPTLPSARQNLLRGEYEKARTQYEELQKDPKTHDAAVLGLSQVLESVGDYDGSLRQIDFALPSSPKNADLHARRAQLLFDRGRLDEADRSIALALASEPNHFLAHWVRALLLRSRGELSQADNEFRWFVRTYTARSDADQNIKDPDTLLLIGQAGCENARWNNLADQFQFVLNEIYAVSIKEDKDFWPAEYQSGLLYLEKFDCGLAVEAFDQALKINPRAALALVGKGQVALTRLRIDEALKLAEKALQINPRLPEALVLRADLELIAGERSAAIADLTAAEHIKPADETILGRLAACRLIARENGEFRTIEARVKARDKKPGMFDFALAEALAKRQRYEQSEKYYRAASEMWPPLSEAWAGLGFLYMYLGREAEARPLLAQAFDADRFNIRVRNALTVLQHLEHYQTERTEHFVIRFDPETDRLLAKELGRHLESTYSALARQYGYDPGGPVLFEVFNNHEMFSGRITALPDLHTIGASTGNVVAMASPHAKGVERPFNWAHVIRHELVHVFNLKQTHFLCTHWLTEGLAVDNEGYPRPQEWMMLLQDRARTAHLLALTNIDLALVRPRDQDEWMLAYCQAWMYVDYLRQRFGVASIPGMLQAYGEGLDTSTAIQKVCHRTVPEFEAGYRDFIQKTLAAIHLPARRKPLTLPQLEERHKQKPHDLDVAAELAWALGQRRREDEALALADDVLNHKPAHALATVIKARSMEDQGDEEGARALLEKALDRRDPEPRLLSLLAKLYTAANMERQALDLFELGRQVQPYENQWLVEMLAARQRLGQRDRQIEILQELITRDPDDIAHRKQLARLLLEAGRAREAETAARQALEIDVLDPEAQKNLADALAAEKHWPEAIATYGIVLQLNSASDEARLGRAGAYLESGDRLRADEDISSVLARDPDNLQAKKLQDRLHR